MDGIAGLRIDYDVSQLSDSALPAEPLPLFEAWLQDAVAAMGPEATAMTLGTSAAGQPAARIVLLKGLDGGGFVFFGNYRSRKGRELDANPLASLVFFWPQLQRQVRVQGAVQRIAAAESDAYFASRPRESQLGAWASPQSQPIADRRQLDQNLADATARFGDREIPRPDHWGGWRLLPQLVEFWQGRPSRLHDRFAFQRVDGQWQRQRLAP